MSRADKYSLLLLAGGKSKRMGADKAKLLYNGKTFVDNLLEKAEQLGITNIYLSGYSQAVGAAKLIQDLYPEVGPLGGIHAGLCQVQTPYCLVLPIDVPQMPVEFLSSLLTYHEEMIERNENKQVPLLLERKEFLEPLIGIYPAVMAGFIEERIQSQMLSVFRMVKAWGHENYRCDIKESDIANINTKEEYERLLKK